MEKKLTVRPEKTTDSATKDGIGEIIKPKKSALRRIVPILFFLLLLFCIFAVIMRLRNPNITLWKMLKIPNLTKKEVIKPRPPKLILSERVTKKISAKDGGSVSVTSKNGYMYQLVIQPGVYTEDPTVNLTPLEEAPFEYPPDPTTGDPPAPPPDPGVDVTVDPPNPPQPPPTEPDDPMPDDNPTGIEIWVWPRRPTFQTGDQQPDPNQIAADIMKTAGLGTILNLPEGSDTTEKTPAPPSGSGTQPPPPVLIFTGRNGPVHILPIYPVWGNGGGTPPSEGGDAPPDGTGAPIGGEGTVTPDDPDGGKGGDQIGQAAGNSGGRCSAEFIAAVMTQYADAGASGQFGAASRYGDLLDECEKEILGYIKRLCQSDRRFLRRADFVTARKLLAMTQAPPDIRDELTRLEGSCTGYYTLVGNGTAPGSGTAGVTMEGSIDANVCGYFDDLWKGKTTYTMTTEGGGHDYDGTTSFRLPPRGGQFVKQDTSSSQSLVVAGRSVAIQIPNLGISGSFDGAYTVNVVLYPMVKLKIEIPLVSKNCAQ